MTRIILVVLGLGLGLAWLSAQTPDRAALPDALNRTIVYCATWRRMPTPARSARNFRGSSTSPGSRPISAGRHVICHFDFQPLTSVNPANKFTIDMKADRLVIWMVKGAMEKYKIQDAGARYRPTG